MLDACRLGKYHQADNNNGNNITIPTSLPPPPPAPLRWQTTVPAAPPLALHAVFAYLLICTRTCHAKRTPVFSQLCDYCTTDSKRDKPFLICFHLLKAAFLNWPNLHMVRPRVWSRTAEPNLSSRSACFVCVFALGWTRRHSAHSIGMRQPK